MEQEQKEEPKQSKEVGFRHWLIRTIITPILLIIMAYLLERYLHLTLLFDVLVGIAVILAIGFSHELIHYYVAVKLGYKPKWWRTRFMMGFEISHTGKLEKKHKERKKIGNAPYYFLVPASIIILILGIYFKSFGLGMAGVGSLIFHGISYPKEGKL